MTDPVNLATALWPKTRHATSIALTVPVAEAKAGANYPHFADQLAASNLAAEAGFEGLWFADHFSFESDAGLRGSWDAWTLMAGIASQVPGVQIGPMVACTAYRNPGVIAKMSEMIQDISGGRFILGLGAGWSKPEYRQFGFRFEPRVSQFEEALQIIRGLLRDGQADFQGEYYQANKAVNLPRSASGHTTPILIGSTGDRMLRLLARYGDAWNVGWGGDTEGLKAKVAKLDAACEAEGRDPKSVVRTVSVGFAGDGFAGDPATIFKGEAEGFVALLHEFEGLGFRHLIVRLDPFSNEAIDVMAPAIERFHSGH